MGTSTDTWWTLLRGVAALNVLAWSAAAWWLWLQRGRWPPDAWQGRRWQLLLSAGYVAGCAWRSLMPVYDVPRIVLVDSFWSSVLVGRSVATLAELCFAAQWALLLREAAARTGQAFSRRVAQAVLPMIAVAELCSWHAVLTTSNLGHVLEEGLWALCVALLVAAVLQLWPQVQPRRRPLLAAWAVAGLLYVGYMLGVDVPMYAARWLADEAAGRAYLGLAQGLADVAGRWVVSADWAHWRTEVVWMTAYFSLAVWLSIALVHAPVLAPATTSRNPQA